MKIAHVMPVRSTEKRKTKVKETLQKVLHPGTTLDIIDYCDGPDDLEYFEDDLKAAMLMVEDKQRLESYDAVNISCFYDPGLRELKEVLTTPVVGIGLASMTLANTLGSRSTVIVGRNKWIPKMTENSIVYGFERNIAKWRSVELSVSELKTNESLSRERVTEQAVKAVDEDRAEVIIMGCAAIDNLENELAEQLGVPVISPIIAGIKMAETLGHLYKTAGLTHSKKYDFESKKN